MSRRLVWFSCGAASAVAAKLAVQKYGDECDVVYCDTFASEHLDNRRFFADVERWIGRSINVIKSDRYNSVDDVFERRKYMSGHDGAICTFEMKKRPRLEMQSPLDVHIFGYTADETARASDFEERNKELRTEWILIDEGITKEMCLGWLRGAGIPLPAMYALGFEHNNCIGCVKSSSPGYWNRTRRLFPEVFERRCHQSRTLGVRLVRVRLPSDPVNGRARRHFLDELPLDADAPDDAIDCGPVCQSPAPAATDDDGQAGMPW